MQFWQTKKKKLMGLSLWAAAFGTAYFGYDYALDSRHAWAEEKREEVRQGLAHAQDLASAFRSVGKVVEPSVVKIDVRKKGATASHRGLDEDTLRRFFPDRDNDGEPDLPRGFDMDELEMPEQMGTGSGVIMEFADGKGYILTNNHVAGGADEILITLHDGREVKTGKVLGADAKTDLAVIEVKAERLSPAKWGNSDDLQKGDWIMAFGSPFGYVGSMTHGIVSALNRQAGILGPQAYESFIQVDAPINPGNSGGPLVNLKGEVVGVNTAIASRSGGFQGIGFAIPSNQAKQIYTQLKDKGKVIRGWLGVGIKDVAKFPDTARSFGYEGDTGVLVEQVIANTPATGKLRHGDIIKSINGKPVESVQQLRNAIAAMSPNSDVNMEVWRKKKLETVTIKLGEQPEDLMAARTTKPTPSNESPTSLDALGVSVATLNSELAEKYQLEVQKGALITKVERNSPAWREGLRMGDVITEVGEHAINSAEDLTEAMKKQDIKKGVRLYVTGRDGSRFVFLSSEK